VLSEMDLNESGLRDAELLELMMAGEERICSLYRKYQSPVYRFSLQSGGSAHSGRSHPRDVLALMRAAAQVSNRTRSTNAVFVRPN